MTSRSHSITIRRFETIDAPVVVGMLQELAAHHGEDALATPADFIRHASGPNRISTILLAVLNGELCAFAATYDWMNYVHGFPVTNIDLFFVRESARRIGVGRALLKAIACHGRLSGCRRMTVGAEPDNESANAFYLKMGFELRRPASNRYTISGANLDQLIAA